ncbi:MAG: hypothetical protein EHM12_10305 [Dehalococcoidia bacterium]|nr:MAG: hypothetical protein EHM12_10305 [Dehalococcoidia bacterium]
MIEDKKLGLKVAENPVEELWTRVQEATTGRIKELKNTLIVEEAFLKMCEEQLKKSIEKPKMVG